jgi:hypothetical protein
MHDSQQGSPLALCQFLSQYLIDHLQQGFLGGPLIGIRAGIREDQGSKVAAVFW